MCSELSSGSVKYPMSTRYERPFKDVPLAMLTSEQFTKKGNTADMNKLSDWRQLSNYPASLLRFVFLRVL
jgi:hypothetical protein